MTGVIEANQRLMTGGLEDEHEHRDQRSNDVCTKGELKLAKSWGRYLDISVQRSCYVTQFRALQIIHSPADTNSYSDEVGCSHIAASGLHQVHCAHPNVHLYSLGKEQGCACHVCTYRSCK
jgi:hypothetical protein